MNCGKCKDTGWLDARATLTFATHTLTGWGSAERDESAEDTVDVIQRRGCDCPAGRAHARRISGSA